MTQNFSGIRLWRMKFGWSQRELAQRIGVDHSTVASWENGTKIPHGPNRAKLCEIFGGALVADGMCHHSSCISEMPLRHGPDWISADGLIDHLDPHERARIIKIIMALIGLLLFGGAVPNLYDLADDLTDLAAILEDVDSN